MNDLLKSFALITQLGLNLFVTVLLGLLVGKFLDDKLNTRPIFLLIFLLMSIIAAFRNLFYLVKKNYFK